MYATFTLLTVRKITRIAGVWRQLAQKKNSEGETHALKLGLESSLKNPFRIPKSRQEKKRKRIFEK